MILTRSNMDQRSGAGGDPVIEIVVAGAKLAEVRAAEGAP
jgi:hypothetical protein